MPDNLNELLKQALASPSSVEGDEGKVQMRTLHELIAAVKYLKKEEQDDGNIKNIFKKIRPGGSLD